VNESIDLWQNKLFPIKLRTCPGHHVRHSKQYDAEGVLQYLVRNIVGQGCSHFFSMRATYKNEQVKMIYLLQKCRTYIC